MRSLHLVRFKLNPFMRQIIQSWSENKMINMRKNNIPYYSNFVMNVEQKFQHNTMTMYLIDLVWSTGVLK